MITKNKMQSEFDRANDGHLSWYDLAYILRDEVDELQSQLDEVREICESRLGSWGYTDAISDIHKAIIGDKK